MQDASSRAFGLTLFCEWSADQESISIRSKFADYSGRLSPIFFQQGLNFPPSESFTSPTFGAR